MYANKVSGLKLKLELRYKKLYVSPSIYKVKLGYHLISKASVAHAIQLIRLKHCRANKEGPIYQKIVLKV